MQMYIGFKSSLYPEKYLSLSINFKFRQILACFRTSCLPLGVEEGRCTGVMYNERYCRVCNVQKVEDEYHFLLECSVYRDLRCMYLPDYLFRQPNPCTFHRMLRLTDEASIRKLSIFLYKAFEKRKEILCHQV